jgi:hypothetical protein
MLQVEWGLTTEQIKNEPMTTIMEIMGYREAEAEGQKRLNVKNK